MNEVIQKYVQGWKNQGISCKIILDRKHPDELPCVWCDTPMEEGTIGSLLFSTIKNPNQNFALVFGLCNKCPNIFADNQLLAQLKQKLTLLLKISPHRLSANKMQVLHQIAEEELSNWT